jgi:hypothetical protein
MKASLIATIMVLGLCAGEGQAWHGSDEDAEWANAIEGSAQTATRNFYIRACSTITGATLASASANAMCVCPQDPLCRFLWSAFIATPAGALGGVVGWKFGKYIAPQVIVSTNE